MVFEGRLRFCPVVAEILFPILQFRFITRVVSLHQAFFSDSWVSGYVVGFCSETDFRSKRIEPIGILKFFGEGPSDNHVNVAEVDDGGVEENFVYLFSKR